MGKIGGYFRLVRPLNLLIVLLTQILFWFCVVSPLYAYYDQAAHLNIWQLAGLILSTVLIAAGGYVINDYYDLPIDLVNKPDRVIISREISDPSGFNFYMVLTATGLLSSLAVAWSLGKPTLVLFPFIISSILWFYAQHFKRSFMIGNVVVAFSTAGVMLILLLFEIDWQAHAVRPDPAINEILKFGSVYMIFAFLMTLLREMVKDLQDREGDAEFECRTLPVVWGVVAGKAVALTWLALTWSAVAWLDLKLFRLENYGPGAYLFLLILLPGVVTAWILVRASGPSDFQKASSWIKAMMVSGVLTMLYIGYIL